ncbi:MAG: hypothetical protein PHN64_03935 [Desulfovibrionaceae bacterium]|nr:hypothetical protein [Desulfovibrionaceae bacterium]
MEEKTIPIDKQPDFLLTIHFPPETKDPQRIFAIASDYIEAMQACDKMLLKSFPTQICPVFILEQIETGSIKIWIKQCVEAIDDDALKNIDWKPAIGKYLVKGKYFLLSKLQGKNCLPNKEELTEISNGLHQLAKESNALTLPTYAKIPVVSIAESSKTISEALANLKSNENITIENDDGNICITAQLKITDEDIKNLLINKTIENTNELILMLRKPDFLGETKWEFRLNRRNMPVSIAHKDWLSSYQAGDIDIRPGDGLHVRMKESISYDLNGEVVSEEREIVEVIAVIRKKEQATLI